MLKYRFGDEIHTVQIPINNLIPPRPSASSIMLKPEIRHYLRGMDDASFSEKLEDTGFYVVFASDIHLQCKDAQSKALKFCSRGFKVSRVTGGKCNFGPVFGQLYTDGFTDTDVADSCEGNSVVQHRRETSQRSLITTYHHQKAQIRNMRGRR
jgi:hypothetical protein